MTPGTEPITTEIKPNTTDTQDLILKKVKIEITNIEKVTKDTINLESITKNIILIKTVNGTMNKNMLIQTMIIKATNITENIRPRKLFAD